MDVRPYRAEDRDAVRGLARRLLIGMADWNAPVASAAVVLRWVDGSLDRAGAEHPVFVAEHDHEVCGFVTVGRTTHFTGRALMAAGEQWATSQGLDRLSLDTGAANAGARAFYAAIGYVEEEVRLSRALTPCTAGRMSS